MEQVDIILAVQKLETKEALLTLLNRIQYDKMQDIGKLDRYRSFTIGQLTYYANPNNITGRFRQFQIPKKSGGKRQITAPKSYTYKLLLQALNEVFKAVYTPSNYAMGFTQGKSVVMNAERHQGMNYVFNTDLKDFFPSITQTQLKKRLQLPPFNISEQMAFFLSGLCVMQKEIHIDKIKRFFYVLPQGAPTSPIITNMICDTLDYQLAGLAKRFRLNYSRYADDITFSSNHNVYQENGPFREELKRIIWGQYLSINATKTRLQKKGQRQEVTGLIVNEKVNVTTKYIRELRDILYIWEQYGYDDAERKFRPRYIAQKGHIKKHNANLANVIDGKLMYLKMVKGEKDAVYLRLSSKFNELLNPSLCKLNEHQQVPITNTPMSDKRTINSMLNQINKWISDNWKGLFVKPSNKTDENTFQVKETVSSPHDNIVDLYEDLNNDLDELLNNNTHER